jgi:DNA mismatch repair ATPase MutS
VEFSVTQLADFYGGLLEMSALAGEGEELPAGLAETLKEIAGLLHNPLIEQIAATTEATDYNERARLTFRARRDLKVTTQALLMHFAYLDAWRSMALATTEHNWVFPQLVGGTTPVLEAEGLYHPLLRKPVPYDLTLDQSHSFLLLTGANMSGKTTLLRSLGIGALLAHLGCGVPATGMRISFLEGIVTNMHVEDNLLKGESYFFAEVQRMKNTALRLQNDSPHLVLMDELFKGTNVHDAYECTRAIVERLAGRAGQLMVLSTHLHEVATHFEGHPALQFARFVTESAPDGSFSFTYKLLPGVSSDRIGFRILQREGVLKLLEGNSGAVQEG